MIDYKELQKQNKLMPDVTVLQHDIQEAATWDQSYMIGQYIYDQGTGEHDRLIMEAFEKAFGLGLNIRVDRKRFLNATQEIAKIYFNFKKYDEAVNKLMVLDSNVDNLPDWVHLYYAAAQIHTESLLYWAEVPSMLFRRIDKIDENDLESVKRRKFLFLEYLNQISKVVKTNDDVQIDINSIVDKAKEYGLDKTQEYLSFKYSVRLSSYLPVNSEENDSSHDTQNFTELQETIESQQEEINSLNSRLDQKNVEVDKLSLIITKYEQQIKQLSDELTKAKEEKYTLKEKYKIIENQLVGTEEEKKILEENTESVGALKAKIEELTEKLNDHDREVDSLYNEINEKDETIHAQADIIRVQDRQIAVYTSSPQLVGSIKDEETINKDKDIFDVDNFLSRKQKILIIGGSETKESYLRGKIKKMGFNFSKDQLEFELEYENVKSYASRIVQWSGKYAGIIVGPCPHKSKDIEGYSSFIAQIESQEGYPHVEEARDKSGKLKISKSSIADAMMKMAVYLQSVA